MLYFYSNLVGTPTCKVRVNARWTVSRLDGKEDEIRRFLGLGVSKTAVAKCGRVPYHPLQLMSTRGLRLSR